MNKEALTDITVVTIACVFIFVGGYLIRPAYGCLAVGGVLLCLVLISRLGGVKK